MLSHPDNKRKKCSFFLRTLIFIVWNLNPAPKDLPKRLTHVVTEMSDSIVVPSWRVWQFHHPCDSFSRFFVNKPFFFIKKPRKRSATITTALWFFTHSFFTFTYISLFFFGLPNINPHVMWVKITQLSNDWWLAWPNNIFFKKYKNCSLHFQRMNEWKIIYWPDNKNKIKN